MKKYRVELVWNREFSWSQWNSGSSDDLQSSIDSAKSIRDSGDGARVKKVRVIENETDKVVWNG